MSSGVSRVAVGSLFGTGVDLTVKTVNFRPKVVKITNLDGLATALWIKGMADDSAVKEITDGTKSAITSDGITPLSDGFGFGADTDLNVDGELVYWEAHE